MQIGLHAPNVISLLLRELRRLSGICWELSRFHGLGIIFDVMYVFNSNMYKV